jgi:hypothetical protein
MGGEFWRQLAEKSSILQDLPGLLPINFGCLTADPPRMQSLTNNLNNGDVTMYGLLFEVVDQILRELDP